MSSVFYTGMFVAIAVIMVIIAVFAAKILVRSTNALLSRLPAILCGGAYLLLGLVTIIALYVVYNFLVVFLLIFTGAAAPSAPEIPEAFSFLSMLWLPVTVGAFVWEVRLLRKRVAV
ncbi:hypothetical protein DL239_04615 [Sedimentitalea sp. CY04]|uniref:Integral membrane protein n=1 Tax=Parasedimentitalea denitrificans TaxID=2211118 RepID=A0ABX0W3X0_9RHOB|nr:hypothetical protein [Sedimentitalea sp. CY04]NIZ60254.1 hypothetical protein [Sedimentitalea sp. CY04]